MKKAMVERLKGVYHVSWFEEDGAPSPVRDFPDEGRGDCGTGYHWGIPA